MARIKVHEMCRLPLNECICPDDDDELEPGDPQDSTDEDET